MRGIAVASKSDEDLKNFIIVDIEPVSALIFDWRKMDPKYDPADDGPETRIIPFFRAHPDGCEFPEYLNKWT
jgi:hypothetical protein